MRGNWYVFFRFISFIFHLTFGKYLGFFLVGKIRDEQIAAFIFFQSGNPCMPSFHNLQFNRLIPYQPTSLRFSVSRSNFSIADLIAIVSSRSFQGLTKKRHLTAVNRFHGRVETGIAGEHDPDRFRISLFYDR
jgi:hypothetical protein